MELVTNVWSWLQSEQGALLFAALWGMSEFLSSFQGVQSNSVFQLFKNGLEKVKGYFSK